jgi:DNA (cytosine-5)-methyltransferase 1
MGNNIKTKKVNKNCLKFMDFCAGIGGGRLGLENLGMECVAFSEIDKKAEKTYRLFFGESEKNYGDLMKINTQELPDFDVMIAGFPCQTFSVVGQRKGMTDARGQVIYGLIKILKDKNIKYFILENVKGLVNHDKGNSLKVILKELDDAGYDVNYKVLNSVNYNTPQHRERVYFVGVRKDISVQGFQFPEPKQTPDIKNYLTDSDDKYVFDEKQKAFYTFKKYLSNKYNLGQHELNKLIKNDFEVIDTRQSDLRVYKGRTPTLRSGRHGILYVKNGKLRKLSGYECLLLQGFPEYYAKKTKGVVQDTHILAQAGNAMTVSTIEEVVRKLLKHIIYPYVTCGSLL